MDEPLSVRYRPLSPACGVEILGLDLSATLPQQTVDEIRALWNEHIVLVFRNQKITEEEQLQFASRFGKLGDRKPPPKKLKERTEGVLQNDQRVMLVSNKTIDGSPIGSFGDGDMWYHIDSGYSKNPYTYTFLYGVELPSEGGNTLFGNMYLAYESLSEELKGKLANQKALHIHQYERRARVDISGDISEIPHWYHPVFVTHPESGRKSLFVDRLMTQRIEGCTHEESEQLLEKLYAAGENPSVVYEHEWELGDFVMWDNRCAIHGRTWFDPKESRLLRRCTIEGGPLYEELSEYSQNRLQL
ncbi:MAG: taurine catabolism dioxygenase TauD [Rhodospirillaceae bacterium]|nr:taurine catabolism dioxygenase TauD [Rhodospirillaceae bacterium]